MNSPIRLPLADDPLISDIEPQILAFLQSCFSCSTGDCPSPPPSLQEWYAKVVASRRATIAAMVEPLLRNKEQEVSSVQQRFRCAASHLNELGMSDDNAWLAWDSARDAYIEALLDHLLLRQVMKRVAVLSE